VAWVRLAALDEEKNTRAKLRTETDRHLGKHTTVILDSLNTIKGYRYELWCMARAAATRCCVVWVQTDSATCREWNASRSLNEARAYAAEKVTLLSLFFAPRKGINCMLYLELPGLAFARTVSPLIMHTHDIMCIRSWLRSP
jgi:hypothetical protein